MSSTWAKKIRYVKDRCVNAYWMLRTGRFKLIIKSIRIEINQRIANIHGWLHKGEELDDSQVPGSAFVDKRKVIPPSYRPTHSQYSPVVPLRTDSRAVAKEIEQILSTFNVRENNNS